MKRLQRLLSMLLAGALSAALFAPAGAEAIRQTQPVQADILSLMSTASAPKSTNIHFGVNVPEDEVEEARTFNQELLSSRGDVLNVEFRFKVRNAAMGEGQWATVTQWLQDLVLASV